jgi:hypothetical protein
VPDFEPVGWLTFCRVRRRLDRIADQLKAHRRRAAARRERRAMTGRLDHPAKLARQAAYWRTRGRADVAEALEAELAGAGRCKRCGRTLTDPASIARGLGPDCLAHMKPAPEEEQP